MIDLSITARGDLPDPRNNPARFSGMGMDDGSALHTLTHGPVGGKCARRRHSSFSISSSIQHTIP